MTLRTRLVMAAIAVLPVVSAVVSACSTAGDDGDDDATSPTPSGDDDSASPTPTPVPITLPDGTFGLWNAYVFPSGDYYLQPRGTVTIASEALTGQVSWEVYANATDFQDGKIQCTYVESVAGGPDDTIPPNAGCVDCGVYYSVTFTVSDPGGCDANAVKALQDGNGSRPDDQDDWGFSSLADDNWPEAWLELPNWTENHEPYLTNHQASYAVWSRNWHGADSAYLPMYALYNPNLDQ